MPQVPAISLPSGGAFGYPATSDPTQEQTTHVLAGTGGSAPNQVVTLDDETGSFPQSKPLGTTTILRGTFASMPAAGVAGRLYFTSDTFVLYRDSGATWVAVGAGLNGSGLVPTAQLGTGTANSGTVLKGDGTWGVATALLGNISKFIVAGHSYNMLVQNIIGAGFTNLGLFANGGSLVDRGQWPNMIQDIMGIASDRKYYYVTLPNTGGGVDYTTYIPVMEDCFIEAVSYYANTALAFAATNYRSFKISVQQGPGATGYNTIAVLTTNNATSFGRGLLSAGVENQLCDFAETTPNVLGGNFQNAYTTATGVAAPTLWAGPVTCPGNGTIKIESLHAGAGAIDGGGQMIIRTGGRIRNYSIGGSCLAQGGVYIGGWATSMNPFWNPRAMLPQNSALPANLTSAFKSTQTTSGGTISTVASSVNVQANSFPASGTVSMWTNGGAVDMTYTGGGGTTTLTGCTIAAGSQTYNSGFQLCDKQVNFQAVVFPSLGGVLNCTNGTQASISNVITFGGTAGTTVAIAGGNAGTAAVGTQAQIIGVTPNLGFETPTGHAVAVLLTGINDCGSAGGANFDIVAYRESLRAWAAFHCCSGFWSMNPSNVFDSNLVVTNGTGTWTTQVAPAWGQFGAGTLSFTGSPNSSSKIVISLGKGYSGGPIDLFFLSWAGTGDGGTASITVDGSTPPQGAVTVCTTGASPTSAQNNQSVAWSGAGTTTLTRTSGTFSRDDVGKKVKGTSIPNGTYIQSYTDSTHVVCNTTIPSTTGTANMLSAVPMVKRLVGLSAGTHTVEITVTAMFNTTGDAEFAYWGYGLEPTTTLLNPTILCNIPQILATYFGFDPNPNAVSLNAEYPKVINGTATALTGNSTEPALPTSVILADLDAAINKNPLYFSNDGLHPNTLGHAIIANTIVTAIKNNFSLLQSFAR